MRKRKSWILSLGILMGLLSLYSCTDDKESSISNPNENEDNSEIGEGSIEVVDSEVSLADFVEGNKSSHESDDDYTLDESAATVITLAQNSITIEGSGASAEGSIVSISSSGSYILSGTLTDGKVIVDTEDEDPVKLVLDGVNITSSDNAPLAIMSAEKAIVTLKAGSENVLTDAEEYVFASEDEDEPNAAFFSKGDLTITGEGSLTVNANYNDGIASKDGLLIKSGSIEVIAADDGIRGKDYLIVEGGDMTINAGGDGFKSDNDEDADRGYIYIQGGTINIAAANDGMQAETDLLVEDGSISIVTADGYQNTSFNSDEESAKGLKANISILLDYGTIVLNCAEDGINGDSLVCINRATVEVSALDDAIHSDLYEYINGGEITILTCNEGLEAPYLIISDGKIDVTASDDALNTSNGGDSEADDGSLMQINGGYIVTNSGADGLDSNGTLEITGGTILVHGPSSGVEVGLDVNGSTTIDGGTMIVAEANSQMIETPSSQSGQYVVMVGFTNSLSANTLFHIADEDGNEIFTYSPENSYGEVTFSCPEIEGGASYTIYTGGTYTGGSSSGGLYSGGSYAGGTVFDSFTVSTVVTTVGSFNSRR